MRTRALSTAALPEVQGAAVRGTLHSGLLLSGMTATGLLGTIVYQLVVAGLFGAGPGMGLYLGLLAGPSLLVGGLTHLFDICAVPSLVTAAQSGAHGQQRDVTNTWITVALLLALGAGLGGVLLAPWLASLLLPGLTPEQVTAGGSIFRLTLGGLLLQGVGRVLTSVCNARAEFLAPAAAALLYQAINFAMLVALYRPLGATSIAVGTLLGGAAMAGVLMLREVGGRGYRPSLCLDHPEVRRGGRMARALLGPTYLNASGPVLERFLAAQISLAAVAYLAYAERLVTLFTTFTAQGFITTFFTLTANQAARQEWKAAEQALVQAVRVLLMLSIPALVAILFLREPLLALGFGRGAFRPVALTGVSSALLGYSGVLIFGGLGSMVSQAFYVRRQARFLALVCWARPLTFLIVAPLLMRIGSFGGLAVAASLTSALATSALYLRAGRHYARGLLSRVMLVYLLRTGGGSLVAAGATVLAMSAWPAGDVVPRGILALAGYTVMWLVCLGYLIPVDEVNWLARRILVLARRLATRWADVIR